MKDPLKDLPYLTVGARRKIRLKAEQAHLRLRRSQRRCFNRDAFLLDSGGRCLNRDLATTVSIDYARAYFSEIADAYMQVAKSYQQLKGLLITAMKFVDSQTIACWNTLGWDDRMSFESGCLPKIRRSLQDAKDERLEHSIETELSQKPPKLMRRVINKPKARLRGSRNRIAAPEGENRVPGTSLDTSPKSLQNDPPGRPTAATSMKRQKRLLQRADGSLYETVDFPTAEEYADITARRRQQLMKDGTLAFTGKGQNRRITVESLVVYCPPAEDAK